MRYKIWPNPLPLPFALNLQFDHHSISHLIKELTTTSRATKLDTSARGMNTPPEKEIMGNESTNISDGQVLEGNKAAAHGKLKSRHLYMIAMGGK